IQKRLRDEGDKLLALFGSLRPEQWRTVIYTDGMTWTIKDVLAHQIAAEREFQFYGRDVLNGGQGAPRDFVINEFNNRSVAAQADRTLAQLIEDFRAARQDSIEFVALIGPDQFAWEGWHPFFGQMTLEDLFKLIYRHNMMHVRDIRHVLGND
ncbi:MAG TPA: DinB family protein, partial [Anaerolineae bacterium]|nr:DinB family protein [Anaerolineae bacterium]